MDEKLIDQLYSRATSLGYKKSRDEFASLVKTDDEVYNDMLSYAQSSGLVSDATQFGSMVGRFQAPYKKKEEPELGLPGQMFQTKPQAKPEPQLRVSPTPVPRGEQRLQSVQRAAMELPSEDGLSASAGIDPRLLRGRRPDIVAESTAPLAAPTLTTPQMEQREAEREAMVPKFAKPLLETITPELTGLEEQFAVPQLNYQFGDLGFKFEESGMTGDYMKATAPSGETIEISLDAFTSGKRTAEADRLRRFIRENTISLPQDRLSKIEQQYKDENRKFLTEEEIKAENKKFAEEQDSLKNEIVELNKLRDLVSGQVDRANAAGGFKSSEEYQTYIVNKNLLDKKQADIKSKIDSYTEREKVLGKAVGKYYQMKSEQGDPLDLIPDALIRGAATVISGIQDLASEIAYLQPIDWLRSADYIKEEYVKIAEKDGIAGPEKNEDGKVTNESYEKWLTGLDEEYRDNLKSRLKDQIKKEEKGIVKEAIKGTGEYFTQTTKEYDQSARQNWLAGAVLGAVESIPAFLGGGAASRVARLIGQTHDHMMTQMSQDPDFDNVSEYEKMAVSLPVSIVVAQLENLGFRNIIANKGLLNKLAMSAIGKAGATTTAKTFGELVRNEVKSGLARGALTIVGGALAEAETGAAQQAAELTAKNIYNAVKEKDMFDLPDTIGEYAIDILNAAAQESVGGFVLGMPSAVAAANRAQGYLGLDDKTFQLFESGATDPNIQTAFVNSLKNKVSSGEMTQAEAKEQLNEYRNAVSLLRSVPNDLSTEDKKKAMNLLRERRGLENQIEGKDQSLVKPQQDRINAINQELTKLSEDAVQKQAAGEVPVQPRAGVGEEVAQGITQPKPEGVTAEGVTAKAQVAPALTEEEVKRKSELEQALASPNEDKKTVTIGESILNIEDAQKELDALNQKEAPIVKAQVEMVQFPTATTTLETEGTGVITEGVEPVFKGSNAPTVNLSTDTQERYAEDYTADEIETSEHAPSSRVVSVASNLGTGQVTYTKQGEKKTFSLPFINTESTKKIQGLREKYKSVKGSSKAANEEKAKLKAEINAESKKVLSDFKNTMVQNLLALYDSLTPEFIAKSKQWYVGANRMAQAIAQKYNISIDQVGGIIAALSPQNDWFNNVSVAERAIEVMTKYAGAKLTKAIVDKAVAYNTDSSGERNSFAQDILDLFNQYGEVSINELQSQGLSPESQSAILRAFDQALHSPKVAMTDPEGKFIGFDKTPVRWNSNTEIAKAISIFRNGSIENINSELGGGNKVRNFYNNIVDPDSETPYLTADTHALSAALNSPISANDAGGIGLFNGGAEPLYALVKAAYIDAARIAGIKPREMQSITWEAQRIGINDKSRTEDKKNETFQYITESRTNNQTPYERATELIARNRSANPSWGAGAGIETQKSSDAIREGAKLRAEQRSREISALRGPAGERVGAAPTSVGRAVAGGPGVTETIKEQKGVPLSNQTLMEEIESRAAKDERVKAVVDAAKKVIATLKSIIPNAQIYLHENPDEYNSFAKSVGSDKSSKGLFSIIKDSSGNVIVRIDINLSNADTTTVYHEVAHAVMYKAFGENTKLFEKFRDQISSVLSKSTVEGLNKFASAYKDEASYEEWLVQFAALMANQGSQIPVSTFQKIAQIVNRIVSRITNGAIVPFKETVSKKEVIDFFNQMSDSIRAGKEISISKTAEAAEIKEVSKAQAGQPVSELPGYDKLMDDVTNTLIPNAIKRKLTGEEMINMVKKFVAKSDIYKVADDIQRDELVRQINGMLGEAYRNPPSAQRLLGLIQDPVKITMTEKQLFAKQIMDQARAAKNVKKVWMKTSQEMASQLKKMAAGGRITINQAAAIIRRMSFVNMLDENSVNSFVDYMAKVFKNAEYANQIANVRKLLRNAKRNAETKIGVANELKPLLRQVFAINPSLIPDNVFEKYAGLVEMMGERAAVLTLEDATDVRKMAEDIMGAVNAELSLVDTLADVFDNYQDKVLDDDGKVMYSDTINKMVDEGKITTSDADILRKYKSVVMPAEPATPMTEQEIADEKRQLEDFVMDSEIDETNLPSRDERDAARKLNALIKTAGVGSLTNTELKNLLKVIANINNGYFPHYAQIMTEKIDAANNNKEVTQFVETAKPLPISKIYARIKKLFVKGKDTIALMVERNPIQYIEQIFGDFKTDTLKKNLFDPIAKAFSNYENEYNKILNKIKDVENSLSKHFKKDGNKITMSKYKMMTYMLQLENDSNPGSKEVAPAMDFLNKTINEIESGETNFTERDAEMLQEIATKFDDGSGNIDINKLYNSFSEAEKNAIKELQNINASLSDKAAYTANVIRGQKFTPLNNYIHHSVIAKSSPTDDATGASLVDQFNASRMPSTRAKSLTERTRGAKPISFDVLDSVSFAAKGQLMDYHLTTVIRTGRRTIDAAKKAARKMGKEKKEIMNAIGGAYERAIETVLVNSYVKSTFADDVVRIMSRQGYRAVLAGTSRFISELVSNVSFVMVKGRKYFIEGFKLKDIVMSADGATAMRNLNSKMTNRAYSSDTQSGNFIDRNIMKQAVGVSGSRAKSDVANKLNQIYSRTLKKPINLVEATADALISTPDKIVIRPAWFGAFSTKYQELTGSKPDLKKIISNDEAYMVDNKEALDEATGFADRETTFVGATDNPFMGILKGTVTKDQSAFSKVFSTFNNYMSRFLIYEYATARTAVNAMVGNGQLSKSEGAALMGAVATRMVMYSFLINLMGTGLIGMLLGDDDEEEENEKTVTQKLGQAVASGAVGLAIGRDFGNVTKNLVNYGVEKINKNYLDFLRNGEYDPYKDAIAFSIIGNEKEGQKSDVTKMLLNMTGPLAPTLKTAYFVAERLARPEPKGVEAKERRKKEMTVRLPLEILGNLGMVPLYKDVRKVVLKEIYKDMEKANRKNKIKKDIKEMLLQGYKSVEDMKRYDNELYEQTYGDGGLEDMLLPEEAMKREIDNEIKRLKREVLDEIMDYTPKEKGKKNSFSKEAFGGGKKFGE